jgi:RNA polymerase sigma-70 factor (ECF subfamily)
MTLSMNQDLDQWFAAEILPHEAALTRYLVRIWPNAADVADFRQDIYVRIYHSAAEVRPHRPKAFLFTTARNLIADRLRRGRIVSIDFTQDLDSLDVLIDEVSPEQRLSARQELRRLSEALDALPNKCREVIWLRRVEGLSQQETARRLGMKEGTVESHLSRGVRVLAQAVFGTVSAKHAEEDGLESSEESEDGRRRNE